MIELAQARSLTRPLRLRLRESRNREAAMFDGSFRTRRRVSQRTGQRQEDRSEFLERQRRERDERRAAQRRETAVFALQAAWRSVQMWRKDANILRAAWDTDHAAILQRHSSEGDAASVGATASGQTVLVVALAKLGWFVSIREDAPRIQLLFEASDIRSSCASIARALACSPSNGTDANASRSTPCGSAALRAVYVACLYTSWLACSSVDGASAWDEVDAILSWTAAATDPAVIASVATQSQESPPALQNASRWLAHHVGPTSARSCLPGLRSALEAALSQGAYRAASRIVSVAGNLLRIAGSHRDKADRENVSAKVFSGILGVGDWPLGACESGLHALAGELDWAVLLRGLERNAASRVSMPSASTQADHSRHADGDVHCALNSSSGTMSALVRLATFAGERVRREGLVYARVFRALASHVPCNALNTLSASNRTTSSSSMPPNREDKGGRGAQTYSDSDSDSESDSESSARAGPADATRLLLRGGQPGNARTGVPGSFRIGSLRKRSQLKIPFGYLGAPHVSPALESVGATALRNSVTVRPHLSLLLSPLQAVAKVLARLPPDDSRREQLLAEACAACGFVWEIARAAPAVRTDVFAAAALGDPRIIRSAVEIALMVSLSASTTAPNGSTQGAGFYRALVSQRKPVFIQFALFFAEVALVRLAVADQSDFLVENGLFFRDRIAPLVADLHAGTLALYWSHQPAAGDALGLEVREALTRLLQSLHDWHSRQRLFPDNFWLHSELRLDDASAAAVLDGNSRTAGVLRNLPFSATFAQRVHVLQSYLSSQRTDEAWTPFMTGGVDTVRLRRDRVFADSYAAMAQLPTEQWRRTMHVQFVNAEGLDEAGIDGGGLFKEFLTVLVREAFDPACGLFCTNAENQLFPSPSSHISGPDHLAKLSFLGSIVGKALFEGILLELPLARFFLRKMLQKRNTLHDLASLDPELHRHLMFLKHYDGDVEDLGLTFTVASDEVQGAHEIELVPGGRDIPVTATNRLRYIHLVAHYRLNVQMRRQMNEFMHGLAHVVPPEILGLFNEGELQLLIAGSEAPLDVEDLRRHTVYAGGYDDDSPAIRAFWQVLGEFDADQRRKFLYFATSCSRPPLLGFNALQPHFAIQQVPDVERLPTASTCMNLLKLPAYSSVHQMREKLLYAVNAEAGFELS